MAQLIRGGAHWIQIREKKTTDVALARSVRRIVESAPVDVDIFVNDRVDLAIGCGAAGVHLGDRDLPPDVASRVAGDRSLRIGVSTHSLEEAVRMSELDLVDYIAIGPIFASPTRMIREPLGLSVLERAREVIEIPIVAIGGIDRTNVGRVLRSGADSAAVISALYQRGTIEDNVRELVDQAYSL